MPGRPRKVLDRPEAPQERRSQQSGNTAMMHALNLPRVQSVYILLISKGRSYIYHIKCSKALICSNDVLSFLHPLVLVQSLERHNPHLKIRVRVWLSNGTRTIMILLGEQALFNPFANGPLTSPSLSAMFEYLPDQRILTTMFCHRSLTC